MVLDAVWTYIRKKINKIKRKYRLQHSILQFILALTPFSLQAMPKQAYSIAVVGPEYFRDLEKFLNKFSSFVLDFWSQGTDCVFSFYCTFSIFVFFNFSLSFVYVLFLLLLISLKHRFVRTHRESVLSLLSSQNATENRTEQKKKNWNAIFMKLFHSFRPESASLVSIREIARFQFPIIIIFFFHLQVVPCILLIYAYFFRLDVCSFLHMILGWWSGIASEFLN